MLLTAANEQMHVAVPTSAYHLTGFREWASSDTFPELGRVTYYRNEIFLDMSPERAQSHNKVKSEICRVLGNLVTQRELGQLFQDGMWFTHDEADLSNEADGMFIAWPSLESGKIRLIPTDEDGDGIEMRGTPDWVLEVVSNSSERKDTTWLPKAYHEAGIREYWLVDARGAAVRFTLFLWRPGGYEASTASDDGWLRSEVFECSFKLERTKDRVGGWAFHLDMK